MTELLSNHACFAFNCNLRPFIEVFRYSLPDFFPSFNLTPLVRRRRLTPA